MPSLSSSDKDLLRNLQAKFTRPGWLKVFRITPGQPPLQIPFGDGVYHPIQPHELVEVDQWLSQNPLMGTGASYRVEYYPEDQVGQRAKRAVWAKTFDAILSTAQALELASPNLAAEAEARETVARLNAGASLDALSRTAADEGPRISEAVHMANSPDPVQQAAGQQNLTAALDRLSGAFTGFQTQANGLLTVLSQPRPGSPVASPPLPAPVAAPAAPPSAYPGAPLPMAGMPQVMNIPGYGPMVLVNGQLVPLQPSLQKQESETDRLLRAVLERQLQPAAPPVDPRLQDEVRQIRERAERAERAAITAQNEAERRAAEAERKAEKTAYEAEIRRLQSESDARFAQMKAELAASSRRPEGDSEGIRYLGLLQSQQQESQRLMAQMQRDAAERDARWQQRLDEMHQRQLEMLQEQASASPTDNMRAVTSAVGEMANLTTQMMTQAARASLMGQPQQGDKKPAWLPAAEKMIDQISMVGAALLSGATGAPQSPPPEPQYMPDPSPPVAALPPPSPPPMASAPQEEAMSSQSPRPISLNAARFVDEARRHAIAGDLATAFKLLDRAFEENPALLDQGGTDDLRDLRAGYILLSGYLPETLQAQDVLQALIAAKGPLVVPRAMRLYKEQQAQVQQPAPAAEPTEPTTIEVSAPLPPPAAPEGEADRTTQE